MFIHHPDETSDDAHLLAYKRATNLKVDASVSKLKRDDESSEIWVYDSTFISPEASK